jgi:uncharacterized protein YhaN
MRFRTIELVRYGGFADRTIDFGDGTIDLHLVVGPNEAGKSTMLTAIGDFLFGIPGQSNQNWRFDYGSLRLRAVLEHDGETIELIRRKGTRNTLLNPDESPASEDALARWLLGLDRLAFERMYGLDHAKLRSGGAMILEGRDEAARIVLEAGTGLSGVGDVLKAYERTAAELFKPGGQNPSVNALMRQRDDAKADLRAMMLGESEWKAVREKAKTARRDREALLTESKALDARTATLARIQRVRAPLGRLAELERSLNPLATIPVMPDDARAGMDLALSSIRTIEIKSEQLRDRITKGLAAAEQIVVSEAVLAHAADIAALEESRPVIDQAARDLGHRKSELAQVDRTIAAARTAAKLKDDAMPSPGWLRRAAVWLDAKRDLGGDMRRHETTRSGLDAQIQKLAAFRPSGEQLDPEPLRTALGRYPSDADDRLTAASDALARAERRVALAITALAPWSGSADSLETLTLPPEALATEHASAIDRARAELEGAIDDEQGAAKRASAAQANVQRLVAAGIVPSAENVHAVRQTRDAVVADVQNRLAGERRADDVPAGIRLSSAIVNADRIADQRESEAARVAEHALALIELEDAGRLRDEAAARNARWATEVGRLDATWADRLRPLGFPEPVPASGYATWRNAQSQALIAVEERIDATRSRIRLADEYEAAIAGIVAEAIRLGATIPVPTTTAKTLQIARACLREFEDVEKAHEVARSQREALAEANAQFALDDQALTRRREALAEEEAGLLAEVGLDRGLGASVIADAVQALKDVGAHISERTGYERQIEGIERDAASFTSDVNALSDRLGEPHPASPTNAVRAWAEQLVAAQGAAQRRSGLQREIEELQAEFDVFSNDRAAADQSLETLRSLAGVATDGGLAEAVAASERKRALMAQQSELLTELASAGDAIPVEVLRSEVDSFTPDDTVAELAGIERRRDEIGTARETIAQSLTEAERAIADAATEDAAADAQQRITDISAQLSQAADAHVAAAASAALLRWLIDKHRALNQAPLMARAAASFATVTRGAFSSLGIDYGDDDRPRLVGIRADGSRVEASGMSEGTRDQLYLALRLAAIETRVGSTVPLICDDLLVTADDQRAGAMLSVLASTASTTQVIVFTHHDHLIEVARQAIGANAFKLHRIEAAPTTAQAA